jgi:CubicO group peptidase (beta-lactamase class C family)
MSKDSFEKVIAGLDEWAIEAMNRDVFAGMALGIVKNGELIYSKGFGFANIEARKPVTPETVFRIASISKTFTGIGLMQLWEKGKFDLDDPINDYLKAFKVNHRDPYAPAITFQHLLTHTSGIGELRNLREVFETFVLDKPRGARKAGEPNMPLGIYMEGELIADAYPGEKWAYANLGFATIGQLIEDISGEAFPAYMLKNVFEPLGMDHSDYLLSARVKDELARGYIFKKGHLQEIPQVYLPRLGAREVKTSLEDMAKYVGALMNGGSNEKGSVLRPETLEWMFAPHYQQDAHLSAMGLAFFIDWFDGIKCVSHGGNLEGFCSYMMVAPQEKLGMVMLVNTSYQMNSVLAVELMRKILELPPLSGKLPYPGVLQSPHLWSEICGFYGPTKGLMSNLRKWMMFGGELEVYVKDNKLMLRSLVGIIPKGIQLYPADKNNPLVFEAFMEGISSTVVFQRNLQGIIDALSASGGEFLTFYKRSYQKSLRFRLTALAGLITGSFLLIPIYKLIKKITK